MSVAQILFSLKLGENDNAYGHVKSVRVHRDFRGMGLGPLLFKEVCNVQHDGGYFLTASTLPLNYVLM